MFKSKSLESILSTFTKTVEDLSILIENNAAKIGGNNKAISALLESNTSLQSDINTAANIKDKLTKLISE